MEINKLTLTQIQSKLRKHQLTVTQLVEYYINNINNSKDNNIYLEVWIEEAMAKARTLDAKIQDEDPSLGKLFGAIISIKDVILYKGHYATASSKILTNHEAIYSSTAVERLLIEDAIIIGRTNCDEFAMGSSNQNSAFGPTKNGINPKYVPGGSSGGAAVSVQLDTCLVALGTDTGGSVRQPAAFTGIYGIKPTYGRISRYGVIAYGSSFDQIGLFGKHILDIEKVYKCIAGHDPMDSTSSEELISTIKDINISKLKYCYLSNTFFSHGVQSEIKNASQNYIERLKHNGHIVDEVAFPWMDYLVSCYYILTTAEASSNLNRYDGIRYGHSSNDVKTIEELYIKTRSEGFGIEVQNRIMLGAFVLSAGYFDAYYKKATLLREKLKSEIQKIFSNYDLILLPVTPTTAWEIGKKAEDPTFEYLQDIFTVLANLVEIPSISCPLGKDDQGMPFGIQIMSNKFKEDLLFKVCEDFK